MQVHIFPGRSNHGEEMVVSRAQPSGDWPQRGSYRTSFLRYSRTSFVLSSLHRLAPPPSLAGPWLECRQACTPACDETKTGDAVFS